jgi:hypothetical protein
MHDAGVVLALLYKKQATQERRGSTGVIMFQSYKLLKGAGQDVVKKVRCP